jgi:hypothetical protein
VLGVENKVEDTTRDVNWYAPGKIDVA